MTRPLRIEFPGALYYLSARGNARQDIFLDDEDRTLFLDLLGQEIGQQRWVCHANCLLDNHYHLLIETPEPNLVRGMARLNGVYSQAYRRHQRVGHLLQGRYQSIIVDKDSYLLELARYIVLNPVRVKLVTNPARWAWSSYRATAGAMAAPPEAVITAVSRAYRIPRKQALDRSHQEALRAAAYLLRRAANLPLNEVAGLVGVSAARVSQIQSAIERDKPGAVLTRLIDHYSGKGLTLS